MGSKKTNSFRLITNGVMTGTATITSTPTAANSGTSQPGQNVQNLDNLGLEISWTGTPTGTITVLGSNSGTTFYALTFNPAITQPAGSAGGYLINLNQFPWPWLQVKYTNASGTGTLNAWLYGKDLN